MTASASELEEALYGQLCLMVGQARQPWPVPEREYRFAPPRHWRADFAYPEQRILIECEGGIYSNGRHVRGKGYEADMEKYSTAAVAGWRVIRVSRRHITSGEALRMIEAALFAEVNR